MIKDYYYPSTSRYNGCMPYRRCGKSGILLPAVSLGLWHNFGGIDSLENSTKKIHYAFDHGITHFDLANNYGPPYGSAEETFGIIMKNSLRPYRDELLISTKAGHDMWDGPYGEWGSRKYLISSLDQSLKRMNLEYVDIFYSHRFDPNTPLDETLQALTDIVRCGKAIYVGISKYPREAAEYAYKYLKENKTPCLLYQGKYNIFDREPATSKILEDCEEKGVGFIAFSPLAQGLLTDRYLKGIPSDSRVGRGGYLKKETLTKETLQKITKLNEFAKKRDQSLAQMSISWLLQDNRVTSVIVGASSVEQLANNIKAVDNLSFDTSELIEINKICNL